MNRTTILTIALLLTIMQFSCERKKKAEMAAYDDWVEYQVEKADTTIYGICMDGSAMHSLQLLSDNGDTLLLDLNDVQEAGKVFGGYKVGDRMAVLYNRKGSKTSMVVNLNTLLGDWVMINPMDGNSEMGMCVRDGGILESINQSNITYQTWRFAEGKLELVGVRDFDGSYEETEVYDFKILTEDSLVIENADETLEYSRPGKVEDYSDIELEDDGLEEMLF